MNCHTGVAEGEMNFAFEGGDESPHSMSEPLHKIGSCPSENARARSASSGGRN